MNNNENLFVLVLVAILLKSPYFHLYITWKNIDAPVKEKKNWNLKNIFIIDISDSSRKWVTKLVQNIWVQICTQVCKQNHVYLKASIVCWSLRWKIRRLFFTFTGYRCKSAPKCWFQGTKRAIFVPKFFGCNNCQIILEALNTNPVYICKNNHRGCKYMLCNDCYKRELLIAIPNGIRKSRRNTQ